MVGLARLIDMDQLPEDSHEVYAEDLLAEGDSSVLPDWVEKCLAKERAWWRLVRRIEET